MKKERQAKVGGTGRDRHRQTDKERQERRRKKERQARVGGTGRDRHRQTDKERQERGRKKERQADRKTTSCTCRQIAYMQTVQ